MNGVDTAGPAGTDQVQPALNDLVEYLKRSHERQNRLRWYNRAATLAILVVFFIYFGLFYGMIQKNLAPEQFNAHVQESVTQLAPVITDASLEVLTQVSPIYIEKATLKLDEITPAVMASLESQTDRFVKNMSQFAEDRLQASLERVVNQVAQEFRKEYPDLTDEQIERFVQETEDEFKEMVAQISQHILDQSLPEIAEMKAIAESLTDGDRNKDTVELYRLFLHKLLLLLDKEIMEG
jgi:hypothetical protein